MREERGKGLFDQAMALVEEIATKSAEVNELEMPCNLHCPSIQLTGQMTPTDRRAGELEGLMTDGSGG